MEAAPTLSRQSTPVVFEDGIGERLSAVGSANESLEVLKVSNELSAVSSFESTLKEQALRLADFRHDAFARVRSVERLDARTSTVVVISERVRGVRLSEVLATAERQGIPLELDAALCLIRQLVTAVAALHDAAPDSCHGAIAPERIVVTPDGRLILAEYVLGPALEELRFSQERYWRELGIALPHTFGLPRFDLFADVTQIGAVALALFLGRRLRAEEYPARIGDVVDSASTPLESGEPQPLPALLRAWLRSALQLEPRHSFVSAIGAKKELEVALSQADPDHERAALRAFLNKYVEAVLAEHVPQHPVQAPTEAVAPAAAAPVTVSAPAATDRPAAPPTAPAAPASPPVAFPVAAPHVPSLVIPPVPVPAAAPPPAQVTVAAQMAAPPPAPVAAPVVPTAAPTPVPVASPFAAPRVAVPTMAPAPAPTPVQAPVPTPAPVSQTVAAPKPAEVGTPLAASAVPSRPVAAPPPAPPVADWHAQAGRPVPPDPLNEPDARDHQHGAARPLWMNRWVGAAAAVLVLATLGFTLLRPRGPAAPATAATGTLTVGTNPDGVAVFIDGVNRGTTPLNVTLPAGEHVLELVTQTERRRVPVALAAGAQVSQYFELPKDAMAAGNGSLQIRTDPPRARVTIDGQLVGRTPTVVNNLTPGAHQVVLESDTERVSEQVVIEAGVTASLVVPMKRLPPGTASGWIAVTVPAEVQIYENQRLIGSSRTDRIMVPVGRHELEFVNESLGFRQTRSVDVSNGQVTAVRPDWPRGSVALNALPWAEVFVDGERLGETPIGGASLPIGVHEVIFRHPELGERKANAIVTMGAPARLSVDMRAK